MKEAERIQQFLETPVYEDINSLLGRLSEINVCLARTGKMLADARLILDRSISASYAEHTKLILKMPATVASKFISSQCPDQNYLVNWLERLNKSCVHQGDNLRTQVSYVKEELRLTKSGY